MCGRHPLRVVLDLCLSWKSEVGRWGGMVRWVHGVVNISFQQGKIQALQKKARVRLVLKKLPLSPTIPGNYRLTFNTLFVGRGVENILASYKGSRMKCII